MEQLYVNANSSTIVITQNTVPNIILSLIQYYLNPPISLSIPDTVSGTPNSAISIAANIISILAFLLNILYPLDIVQ